MLLITLCTI